MRYYSLNRSAPVVTFREATLQGQAPDKGLYFPEHLPEVDAGLIRRIGDYSREEIAFRVIQPYVGSTIPEDDLFRIVSETVNFEMPLVAVTDTIQSLELFHGPTLAFKDVGARFMSRCLGRFAGGIGKRIVVLVATSGDTGGAVAQGFHGVEGVDVVILYPSGKVSNVQEKQLTTLGHNITALEVAGSFDDCQRMVKHAFADPALRERLFLTSANSINVARWLPQQFYYFFAWQQWTDKNHPPVISVPSGNFGNICAGILAHVTGLPVARFIAACNANDIVPQFMHTQTYQPRKAVATISNAMDVGDPSNFVRILELFNQQFPDLQKTLASTSISDKETRETIRSVFNRCGYVMDPHGAVGFLALERYLADHEGQKGIFLETAHPVKFYDVVEPVIGQAVTIPESVRMIMNEPKRSIRIEPEYEALYDVLVKK